MSNNNQIPVNMNNIPIQSNSINNPINNLNQMYNDYSLISYYKDSILSKEIDCQEDWWIDWKILNHTNAQFGKEIICFWLG